MLLGILLIEGWLERGRLGVGADELGRFDGAVSGRRALRIEF